MIPCDEYISACLPSSHESHVSGCNVLTEGSRFPARAHCVSPSLAFADSPESWDPGGRPAKTSPNNGKFLKGDMPHEIGMSSPRAGLAKRIAERVTRGPEDGFVTFGRISRSGRTPKTRQSGGGTRGVDVISQDESRTNHDLQKRRLRSAKGEGFSFFCEGRDESPRIVAVDGEILLSIAMIDCELNPLVAKTLRYRHRYRSSRYDNLHGLVPFHSVGLVVGPFFSPDAIQS